MMNRGLTEVKQELDRLDGDQLNVDNHNLEVMIDALKWGLNTMRTTYALEARLFHDDDLEPLITEITNYWDGQGFISGGLAAANRYIREEANAIHQDSQAV